MDLRVFFKVLFNFKFERSFDGKEWILMCKSVAIKTNYFNRWNCEFRMHIAKEKHAI